MPLGNVSREPARLRGMRPVSARWMVTLISAVLIGFCGIGASFLIGMRHTDHENARQAAQNLVTTLAADIERNLNLYDLSLQAVVDGLQLPEIDQVSPAIRQFILFDRAASAEHLGAILVLDENGFIRLGSRRWNNRTESLAGRDYFRAHVDNPDLGLFVGAPFTSYNGEYAIGISRRLSRPDGSFAGIVAGTIHLSYFHELFRRLTLTAGGSLSLVRTDGKLVIRIPFRSDQIGHDFRGTELFRHVPQSGFGSFETRAMIDGVERLFVFKKLDDYPLIVSAGLSLDTVYQAWRREAVIIGSLMIALCAVTIGLTYALTRELTWRAATERSLARLATTDSVTGIHNRLRFNLEIEQQWAEASARAAPLALLMIDADHFKVYNDCHGHQAGDRLLAEIASRIVASCERGDFVARYGGEEFVVLLPGCSLEQAVARADRIRTGIVQMGVQNSAGAAGLQTVSIGVASLIPTRGTDHRALIAAADSALYQAKRNGRDRIEMSHGVLPAAAEAMAAAAQR